MRVGAPGTGYGSVLLPRRRGRATSGGRRRAAIAVQRCFRAYVARRYAREVSNADEADAVTQEPLSAVPRGLLCTELRGGCARPGGRAGWRRRSGYDAAARLEWLLRSEAHPLTRQRLSKAGRRRCAAAVARFVRREDARMAWLSRAASAQRDHLVSLLRRHRATCWLERHGTDLLLLRDDDRGTHILTGLLVDEHNVATVSIAVLMRAMAALDESSAASPSGTSEDASSDSDPDPDSDSDDNSSASSSSSSSSAAADTASDSSSSSDTDDSGSGSGSGSDDSDSDRTAAKTSDSDSDPPPAQSTSLHDGATAGAGRGDLPETVSSSSDPDSGSGSDSDTKRSTAHSGSDSDAGTQPAIMFPIGRRAPLCAPDHATAVQTRGRDAAARDENQTPSDHDGKVGTARNVRPSDNTSRRRRRRRRQSTRPSDNDGDGYGDGYGDGNSDGGSSDDIPRREPGEHDGGGAGRKRARTDGPPSTRRAVNRPGAPQRIGIARTRHRGLRSRFRVPPRTTQPTGPRRCV